MISPLDVLITPTSMGSPLENIIYCLFQKVGPDFLPLPILKIEFFSLFMSCFEMAITFDRLELRKNRK